jgi:hypothetical protein
MSGAFDRPDAPADAIACFEHDDVVTRTGDESRRIQSCIPAADDGYVSSLHTNIVSSHNGFSHERTRGTCRATDKEGLMGLVLLILLLALLFGGLGFAVHWLWILAVILAIFWIAGFAFRSGEGSWYRW